MAPRASNIIDVCVELRSDDSAKAAIAVFDGKTDEKGREVWIWLPRSQIEIEHGKDGTATVSLPDWLANEKELI